MKKEAILLVLAAGMGSRYGGLKQIDPVGPSGETLMDYSLYDAKKAGFKRIVFVIKEQDKDAFHQAIGHRIGEHFNVQYAFQALNDLPEGYQLPEERQKPWGTSHAVLAARKLIDAPFAVINADDYYGEQAFHLVYDFLQKADDSPPLTSLMVNYILEKTLSDHGHVARGICSISSDGWLENIVERTMIQRDCQGASYSEDGGEHWEEVDVLSPVSMNFWGFPKGVMQLFEEGFPVFLSQALQANPLRAEYLVPSEVGRLLRLEKLQVRCQTSSDQWHGVTYQEDKAAVVAAIAAMIAKGRYPENLWGA